MKQKSMDICEGTSFFFFFVYDFAILFLTEYGRTYCEGILRIYSMLQ